MNHIFWGVVLAFGWTASACLGAVKTDRAFLDGLLRLPSESGMREGRMSAATDASYYAQLDIPIVIFAADGGEPHSDREWGSLSSLDAYTDFFVNYLLGR